MIHIKVLSDLHLEFYKGKRFINKVHSILNSFEQSSQNNEILLLAGDIGRVDTIANYEKYKFFLNSVSPLFQHVLFIPGNHEYYGSSIEKTNQKLSQLAHENIHFLDNSVFTINNLCVLGSTLWSPGNPQEFMKINDFHEIQDFFHTFENYHNIHQQHKKWLEETISLNQHDYQLLLLTHHQPSRRLIHPKYNQYEHLNPFFAAEMDHLFNYACIKYWVYGHTHTPFYGKIDSSNIHFVCHPYGYPNENPNIPFFYEFEI